MKLNTYLALAWIVFFIFPTAQAQNTNHKTNSSSSVTGAAAEGDLKTLSRLIKDNPDLNQTDAAGNTALILAAAKGEEKIVQLLLKNKVKLDIKNKEGQTALYFALINEQPDIALSLVNKGAALEDINNDGDSALQIATTSNANEVMKLVIKKNPSLINKPNNSGITPLMEAARFGSAKTIKILLNSKANGNLKNPNGKTALDIAIKAQNSEAIKLLGNK